MNLKKRMHTVAFTRLRADQGMLMPQAGAADAKWCALFPKGQWHHHSGNDFDFDAELVGEFIANWKKAGSPPLPITLHHVPDDIDVESKATAGVAMGWIEDLRPGTGDTALEGAVKWVEDAKALIAADKYRYLSPEWAMAHRDRRDGSDGGPWLFGAALLNDPFFHTMPRVAASSKSSTSTQTPNAASKAKEQHMFKRLCAALRLPETATEEEVAAAVEKLSASHTDVEVKLVAAAKQSAAADAMKQTLDVLKASNEELTKKFAAAEEAQKATALAALIDGARREGKAMPEPLVASITFLAKHDFGEAQKLVASLPKNAALAPELGANAGGSNEETVESARAKFEASVEAMVKAEPGLTRTAARDRFFATNPKLVAVLSGDTTTPDKKKEVRS